MAWYSTWHSRLMSMSVLAGFIMIAVIICCRPAGDTNLMPPAGAAAADFSKLIFQEEFDDASGIDLEDTREPGFNFYPKLLYGDYVLPAEHIKVSEGVLHLFNPENHAQGDLFTAVTTGPDEWIGFTASKENGGAYFEASIAFDPTTEPVDGFPAFWTLAVEHFAGSFDKTKPHQFLEIDFMEYNWKWYDDPTDYLHANHIWQMDPDSGRTIVTIPKPRSALVIDTPEGTDYNRFNTFGCLWIPGEDGRIDTYFNNELLRSVQFKEYPVARCADDLHFPVFLGCGNWPIKVDWVRVWALK